MSRRRTPETIEEVQALIAYHERQMRRQGGRSDLDGAKIHTAKAARWRKALKQLVADAEAQAQTPEATKEEDPS